MGSLIEFKIIYVFFNKLLSFLNIVEKFCRFVKYNAEFIIIFVRDLCE